MTIFHHSVEEHQVDGPVAADIKIALKYNNTVAEMKALIKESRLCQQYIEVKSLNSRVFDEEMTPMKWWVSVENQNMTNWGTPTGTYGCPCGITQMQSK